MDEAGQFGLVDQGDRGVLHRDPAAAVGVQDGLVAAGPEAAGALTGGDLLGGAEVGPEPVRTRRARRGPWILPEV
ncbi:hypothetical protein ATKI12_4127 [Kitasatospora sp. Ki12]